MNPIRLGGHAVLLGDTRACHYSYRADNVVLVSREAENPDLRLFQRDDVHRLWVAKVPWTECERVYSVQTFATWRGHLVDILCVSDHGMVEAIYAGASTGWALDNGFVQADKYEYRREVAITELTNVYEEQRDLIFDLWRENRTPAAEAYRRPRIGVYVTIAGQEHRARSIDDSGIVVLTDRRQVAAGECERVVDVVTLASHLELECEVTAINADGSACLRLCGDDRFAETRGFTRTDSGGWTKSADLQSLMHYRERHRPLAGTGRR